MTLVHQFEKAKGRFGLATLSVGVGVGLSLAVERVDRAVQKARGN